MVTQTQTSSKMALLTGSEKQIAWATTIRREAIVAFTVQANRVKTALATPGISADAELALDGALVAMRRILAVESTAKFWIENRTTLVASMVGMIDTLFGFYLPAQAAVAVTPVAEAAPVQLGTFTLVTEDGEWTTLRIERRDVTDNRTGTTSEKIMASYLSGANNETDYQGFAWVEGRTARVWRRFAGIPQVKALEALLALDTDGLHAAGYAYAKESGNCWVCGRKLTTPTSIELGIGPVCADKLAA